MHCILPRLRICCTSAVTLYAETMYTCTRALQLRSVFQQAGIRKHQPLCCRSCQACMNHNRELLRPRRDFCMPLSRCLTLPGREQSNEGQAACQEKSRLQSLARSRPKPFIDINPASNAQSACSYGSNANGQPLRSLISVS